jgi:hypothetical protein
VQWTGPPDEDESDDPVCITCLIRPPKPGSVYCSRLCRLFGRLRGLWAEAEELLAQLHQPVGL